MMSLESRYKHADAIIKREIVGEALLIPVRGELAMLQRVYSLTPVASVIWDHLDGQHNLRGIAEKVTQQFDTDLEHATKDCVEFVEALLEAELVAKA